MKRVASFSVVTLVLSTLFLFVGVPSKANAASCTAPTQSTFTETGTVYTLQTFTASAVNCTWSVPLGVTSLRIVIVGGGGGAGFGACGGGGGAGRVLLSNSSINVTATDLLTLTIGNGGLGGWRTSSDWRMGINGESSSATINGTTIIASGGGGGGGGATRDGLAGGSGGGGTACSVAAGGAADASVVSGFTSYANAGANGVSAGGGGGGAGAAGSDRNGGNGITIWGATFAGGGGGWGVGTGGTGGGGAASNGTDPKSSAGNPGTAGTGSGGGGGNDGGTGRIMIRYLVNATLSGPSLSGSAVKGVSITITVTSTVAGRVRFFSSGKRIARCLSVSTSGTSPNFTATCNWVPPTRGNHFLQATLTPTDSALSTVNTLTNRVFVLNRSTKR